MSFKEDGFEIVRDVFSSKDLAPINEEFSSMELSIIGGGLRNADKKLSSVRSLLFSPNLTTLIQNYFPGHAQLVRAILFVKTQSNNWLVTWHQDKTVSVSQKFEATGWGPWSQKDGVLHVQPPPEVLSQMITFRVHLDDSTEENGCLKLIPNSHTGGLLSQAAINDYSKEAAINCLAPLGSVLVMRPHLLHASSKATSSNPRRVLHLEYSSHKLPEGVQWA